MLNRKPMSRSGFKRPAIERAPRAPLVPVTGCRGVYAPVGGDVAVSVPKEIILRSRPYRMWVATHPCDLCGWPETQCAHENLGKAMQGRVCDSRTFSLCIAHGAHAGHHFLFDNYVDISREEAREVGARLSARMRERAAADGWRFTGTAIVRPGVAA